MLPAHDNAPLKPGFRDPLFEAQSTFRSVMQALSRPGVPVHRTFSLTPPEPLNAAAAAVALTLCDIETPLWLDPSMKTEETERFLRFHCGCPIAEMPSAACFALVADSRRMPALDEFRQGDEEYPDRSATLILQVDGLDQGSAFRLSGPGINGSVELSVCGLPNWFAAAWKLNHAQYPVGVDVILATPDTIVGLPRSTKLED